MEDDKTPPHTFVSPKPTPPVAPPSGDEDPDPGKLIYDYSDIMKKEPELITLEKDKAKEKLSAEKKDKKRRVKIEIEKSNDVVLKRDKDGIVEKGFKGVFGIFDSLFDFVGLSSSSSSSSSTKPKDKEKER